MVSLIRASGAEMVLVGVPRSALILSTAPLYAQIAEQLKVPFFAGELATILSERGLQSDAAYPNAASYRRLAEALVELLREARAI